MSRRLRILTNEDLALHTSSSSCWISRKGKVYDVTGFLKDHPGGDDYILNWAGKDVEEIMKDKGEHEHSDSAYEMLEEYVVGKLGTGESIVRDDWEATDDFHPDDTDEAKDFEKNQFLDLRKPLLRQVWEANFSKSYYLKQVHQPRHLAESARLFGPDILEITTRTVWWVIPLFWAPISFYLFLRSVLQFTPSVSVAPFVSTPILPLSLPFPLPPAFAASLSSTSWPLSTANFTTAAYAPIGTTLSLTEIPSSSVVKAFLSFLLGNAIWTLIEYGMHRFLFHIDDWLPDRPVFLTLHFLLHGIHHYLPMDRSV
ncbi:hypothetical protein AX16_006369 [Volvariella volvacea WC 439]|nr:hypothetical protein AX16_006369 [Volvariella volvacea WC 439]